MNLIALTRWELLFLARYQLVGISIFVSALYVFLFTVLDLDHPNVIIIAVFSDPVMLGFLFTGALILYDNAQRTHRALAVTPTSVSSLLLARGLALTVLAEMCSFAIVVSGAGFDFNPVLFFTAVALNSLAYYYLGVICLSGADSFNGFIMRAVLFFTPLSFPLLGLFDIFHHKFFYLIPTQASLLSLSSGMVPVSLAASVYAFGYLLVCLALAKYLAERLYARRVVHS